LHNQMVVWVLYREFYFRTEDMLAILFPHMFEDLEYLLPVEDAVYDGAVPSGSGRSWMNDQNVAGPSRAR
jgi:E3 ubiquitin-protein ligase SHPRH